MRAISRTLRAAGALLLLGALAGGDAPPASAAAADLVLEASLDETSVDLGEDVVLRLRVRNHSTRAVTVPRLRLARDSVSVGVELPGGGRAEVTRRHGTFVEEGGQIELRERATDGVEVAPGRSVEGTLSFPAVVAGTLRLRPVLGPEGPERVQGPALAVEVEPGAAVPKRLVAQVETTAGSFAVELDGARAFNAVSQFSRLANEGFYDGLAFHRVVPGLLVQGGDPRGDGTGGPGWYLPSEAPADPPPLARGDVGLARGTHPDSQGSQWFAVADPAGLAERDLERGFTPLGRVVAGPEVVDALAAAEVVQGSDRPVTPATVVRLRVARR